MFRKINKTREIISNLVEKLPNKLIMPGMILMFAAVMLFIPGLILICLSLIGVNVEWLSLWPWIGASILWVILD